MANKTAPSPFFARSYGGFTQDQFDFAQSIIADYPPGPLIDPMAGQARDLGKLAMAGCKVIIEDVNPACLCLAALRSPQIVKNADKLFNDYLKKLSTIRARAILETEFVCDEWLTPSVRDFIQEYRQRFQIGSETTPFEEGTAFWMDDLSKVFAVSMLVLAARQFVCHRPSRNATWIKKGGVIPHVELLGLLHDFAKLWKLTMNDVDHQNSAVGNAEFVISTAISDWTLRGREQRVMGVITSPPYANRLDYAVMWSPELATLCELFSENFNNIKRAQIGTTVVRGLNNGGCLAGDLPISASRFLDEVGSGKAKASESYYLPFFKNYLLSLSRKIRSAAKLVESGGYFICFIRDCARMDARLDAERFVAELLTASGFTYAGSEGAKKLIIRNHVGLRRPVDKGAIHGSAQTEWYLHFRKL